MSSFLFQSPLVIVNIELQILFLHHIFFCFYCILRFFKTSILIDSQIHLHQALLHFPFWLNLLLNKHGQFHPQSLVMYRKKLLTLCFYIHSLSLLLIHVLHIQWFFTFFKLSSGYFNDGPFVVLFDTVQLKPIYFHLLSQ